jgi:hypothetical protein
MLGRVKRLHPFPASQTDQTPPVRIKDSSPEVKCPNPQPGICLFLAESLGLIMRGSFLSWAPRGS